MTYTVTEATRVLITDLVTSIGNTLMYAQQAMPIMGLLDKACSQPGNDPAIRAKLLIIVENWRRAATNYAPMLVALNEMNDSGTDYKPPNLPEAPPTPPTLAPTE